MNCEHPGLKATTSYRYGCRCDRCRSGKKRERRKSYKKKYKPYRPVNLPSRNPEYIRKTERPTSTAFGGC